MKWETSSFPLVSSWIPHRSASSLEFSAWCPLGSRAEPSIWGKLVKSDDLSLWWVQDGNLKHAFPSPSPSCSLHFLFPHTIISFSSSHFFLTLRCQAARADELNGTYLMTHLEIKCFVAMIYITATYIINPGSTEDGSLDYPAKESGHNQYLSDLGQDPCNREFSGQTLGGK